jgi:DNA polymerase-3 subunit epsilon
MKFGGGVYKKIHRYLALDKPLVVFDIETTGLNLSSDKIVELAYIKIWDNGRMKQDDMILDPEIKIGLESIAVHGIRNRDVKGKPKFRDRVQELWDVFHDCYYSGFNIINFDLPILRREFIRIGMDFEYSTKQIIDSREIFLKMVPRTLSSTYEYFCHKKFKEWHTALNDTEASLEILVKQLEKYKEIRDWEFINKIHKSEEDEYSDGTLKFYWLRGEAYFAFSKYRDRRLKDIAREDPEFLEWILSADFSEEVKNIVEKALEKNIRPDSLVHKIKSKL